MRRAHHALDDARTAVDAIPASARSEATAEAAGSPRRASARVDTALGYVRCLARMSPERTVFNTLRTRARDAFAFNVRRDPDCERSAGGILVVDQCDANGAIVSHVPDDDELTAIGGLGDDALLAVREAVSGDPERAGEIDVIVSAGSMTPCLTNTTVWRLVLDRRD